MWVKSCVKIKDSVMGDVGFMFKRATLCAFFINERERERERERKRKGRGSEATALHKIPS